MIKSFPTVVVVLFALSGFAALLYETAWIRLFSIAFGTSEISVVIVLAGYMAGLALGALVVARLVGRVRRPMLIFGLLEGAIALAALAMPLIVDLTGEFHAWLWGNQPRPPDAGGFGQLLFYGFASILILLVPTGLMGATLPLLVRHTVTSSRNLGARIALLYGMNTLGAVAGTLTAGFLLLPALGLRGTVWVGVAVNGLVFAAAVCLARQSRPIQFLTQPSTAHSPLGGRVVLPLIAFSGVLSFTYEVLWTRMLSHVLGSSIHALSTMLAAFLTGIALGAMGAGPAAKNRGNALGYFGWCQIGIAVSSALVYSCLEGWSPSNSNHVPLAFAVILPPAFFIGATYPLAVRVYAGDGAAAARSSAIVYSWNTLASILGALLAGFLVIPVLGYTDTARLAVLGNLLIGLAALAAGARNRGRVGVSAPAGSWHPLWRPPSGTPALVGALVIATFTGVLFQPQRLDALVTHPIFGGSSEDTLREVYYAVGRSSTVQLTENIRRFDLSTNGLPEAQIEFKGAPPLLISQRWLGMWPSLIRPDTESLLVVGLGGGVVVEGVPGAVDVIDVVELEAEVVRANAVIGPRRTMDPLVDARTRVIVNDARNALRLTSQRYDAIVSQPSHPWTAGSSHLFTREFFALAKSRLTDDGVFIQWMNAEMLDETLLRRLAASLLAEFENVRVYQPTALALHFLASDGPLDIERQLDTTGRPLRDAPEHFSRNGIGGPLDVVATLLLDETGVNVLAAGHNPVTDDDNAMALNSRVLADGLGIDSLAEIIADLDPLGDSESWARRGLNDGDFAYVATRLVWDGQAMRVKRLIDTLDNASSRFLLRAILLRHDARYAAAESVLKHIGPDEPAYESAVFLRILDRTSISGLAGDLPGVSHAVGINNRLDAVLAGWRARAAGEWPNLVALDTRLEQSHMTDFWAPEATLLRAAWRLHIKDYNGKLAREALTLIDRSVASRATPDGYSLRAQIGLKLNDAPVFVESVAFMIQSVRWWLAGLQQRKTSLTAEEHQWVTSRLQCFGDSLRQLGSEDTGDRAVVVLLDLMALLRELNSA